MSKYKLLPPPTGTGHWTKTISIETKKVFSQDVIAEVIENGVIDRPGIWVLFSPEGDAVTGVSFVIKSVATPRFVIDHEASSGTRR